MESIIVERRKWIKQTREEVIDVYGTTMEQKGSCSEVVESCGDVILFDFTWIKK